jgi:hypothetical protein
MTKPMIRIHNLETNEIIDREMNDDEFLQYQSDKADAEVKAKADADAANAKAVLLNRLGITAEEAQLLLG